MPFLSAHQLMVHAGRWLGPGQVAGGADSGLGRHPLILLFPPPPPHKEGTEYTAILVG